MNGLILTPDQINELRRAHRLTKDKRAADRIKAVYSLAVGFSSTAMICVHLPESKSVTTLPSDSRFLSAATYTVNVVERKSTKRMSNIQASATPQFLKLFSTVSSKSPEVFKGVSPEIEGWLTWKGEPSTNSWNFDKAEAAHIIKGHMTIISEVYKGTFGPGDTIIFPKGFHCTAIIHDSLVKRYSECQEKISFLLEEVARRPLCPS